ncbi:CALCIUM-DEPENDENT LIPID-BINDING (CALB DOMAIN) FAMILY PROTEIN [Salix purpurea]|uniref:CALCIUM-DEPENDENT LIPID-BINDING (CALB DOMAIN) FAMILY PROTEIN n=1 Tax=Salix purpurea TaxID=77065 RepID=A0A9Q0ZA33_SALPP|nr:CALCIUM-DEPENDENT LIPID-BINDING (CALB DOMAIN) FAMILY PROTEIN [Salix purpurea]KAJ6726749.1 CALCIUM-DEPENDENT LIPID-BINDING (CALB DOMAIN) FAMILY PROTEIN [Salix purpurea]
MTLQSPPASFSSYRILPLLCPCKSFHQTNYPSLPFSKRRRKKRITNLTHQDFRRKFLTFHACVFPNDTRNSNVNIDELSKGTKRFVLKRIANDLETGELSQEPSISNFNGFQEDPIVGKLRTQLGVIRPIPSFPINRNIVGLFVFFFFVGVIFDKVWTSRKRDKNNDVGKRGGAWPQVPTSFSLFLEKDLQRKESVEWVNMVLGKLWKVYRGGIENWLIGLLQPVIDDLKKPDYVERVEIKQFSLGDEPLSVRNVERRTSRRVNDLQYQIGLRYTGGARMLLMLSLKFSIIPIVLPVSVRDFDIDGELWVKLRLIPTEPWVGAVSWAFVSIPKIKFELSPFRLFNLMAIPVVSLFLTKLLTADLPRLFVRPKKIVLDFQNGKAVGPVANESGEMQGGNEDFVGELSVTLVDARKLSYVLSGKTDPYVILSLGDQIMRSKKNSQTTVIGRPGEPIWNQDFHMLVANPRKQKLSIQVKDSLGFTDLTVGTGEVDLGSLQDTVPTDKIVALRGGWGLFRKASSGEILLRLTYKAYVEDEDDDEYAVEPASDDELSDSDDSNAIYEPSRKKSSDEMDKESFMDVLAALIVSEEFQGIVASETGNSKLSIDASSLNAESMPSDSNNSSEGSAGSILVWFAVITSILVLIAVTMDGSSFFNP